MTTRKKTTAIILAAGKGTRMKSQLPKVLHQLCGASMIEHVVKAAFEAGCDDAVVVVGYERARVEAELSRTFGDRVRTEVQGQQNGTGHAVRCGIPGLSDDCTSTLLLYGDTPLLDAKVLANLIKLRGKASMSMLTCRVDDPTGYGRIVRGDDGVEAIVEHRDASEEQLAITEVNPGVYAADREFLEEALSALKPNNDQGELYLTDIVGIAAAASVPALALVADAASLVGINDRRQLAAAEAVLYRRIADAWRAHGATIAAGARIDADVTIGSDATIGPHTVLRSGSSVGANAFVDAGCVLDNTTVADGAVLLPYTVCRDAVVGEQATLGPFTHLRPGSDIGPEAKVGNFVEIKKTKLHRGAKANHLAYLGDGDVGEGANVGAGTIFCNYDGFQKHQTVIGKGAFIGSDSQIVAPVTIGDGAYVATGTTVTKDVPADALAIGRIKQENKEGYAARLRGRLKAAKEAAKKTQ